VAVLFSSNVTEASGPWSFNYSPSQTTWTVPVGVNKIKIQLWGAGGAGGSGKVVDGIHYPGMGGGAGSYAESIYSVSPNDQFVIDIGRGGRSVVNAASTQGGFTVIRKKPLTSGVGGIPDGTSDVSLQAGPGSGGVSYLKGVPTNLFTVSVTLQGGASQTFSLPAFSTDPTVAIAGGSATDCYGNPTKLYYGNDTQRTFFHGEHGFGQIAGSLYKVTNWASINYAPYDCKTTTLPFYYLTPLIVTTQSLVDFYTNNGKADIGPWLNDIGGGGDTRGFLIAGTGNIYFTGPTPTVRSGHPGGFPKYLGANVPLAASNGGDGPLGEKGGIAGNNGHGTDMNIDGASPSAGGGGAENGLGGYGGDGLVVITDVSSSNYIDIGLRIQQGTQAVPDIKHLAIEDPGSSPTSPLKIVKNGTSYGTNIFHVALVDPTDSNATKIHIKLADGSIKALRSCTINNGCAFVP